MKIELGRTYRDKITGVTGVAICFVEYLTGCDRVGIQQPMNKSGIVPEPTYFDTNILDLVASKKRIAPHRDAFDPPGGPQPAPKGWQNPR